MVLAFLAALLLVPLISPVGVNSLDVAQLDLTRSANVAPARTPRPAELATIFEGARNFWAQVVPATDARHMTAAASASGDDAEALDAGALATALAAATDDWAAADGSAEVSGANATIGDLPGDQLASTDGDTITVDATAAGHGWGGNGMDLVTVLRHELGHVAGREHTSDGLMEPSLASGEVHGVPSGSTDQAAQATTDKTSAEESDAEQPGAEASTGEASGDETPDEADPPDEAAGGDAQDTAGPTPKHISPPTLHYAVAVPPKRPERFMVSGKERGRRGRAKRGIEQLLTATGRRPIGFCLDLFAVPRLAPWYLNSNAEPEICQVSPGGRGLRASEK